MYKRHLIQLHHDNEISLPPKEIEAVQLFTAGIKWCEDERIFFKRENETAKLQERTTRQARTIKINGARHHPKELYYDPDELDPDTNTKGVMKVGKEKVEAQIHDYTTRSKGQEGNRPRSFPSAGVVGMLNAPLVDGTNGEVTRIEFINGRKNTVFFCKWKQSVSDHEANIREFSAVWKSD